MDNRNPRVHDLSDNRNRVGYSDSGGDHDSPSNQNPLGEGMRVVRLSRINLMLNEQAKKQHWFSLVQYDLPHKSNHICISFLSLDQQIFMHSM
jgi:hypothetical protein